jgi:hypothetical protein
VLPTKHFLFFQLSASNFQLFVFTILLSATSYQLPASLPFAAEKRLFLPLLTD